MGFISAVFANKLPGPGTDYLGQTIRFKAPVRPGDSVVATATVKETLAVCQRIVDRHGGRIWVEARENEKGGTFRFSIPADGQNRGRPQP